MVMSGRRRANSGPATLLTQRSKHKFDSMRGVDSEYSVRRLRQFVGERKHEMTSAFGDSSPQNPLDFLTSASHIDDFELEVSADSPSNLPQTFRPSKRVAAEQCQYPSTAKPSTPGGGKKSSKKARPKTAGPLGRHSSAGTAKTPSVPQTGLVYAGFMKTTSVSTTRKYDYVRSSGYGKPSRRGVVRYTDITKKRKEKKSGKKRSATGEYEDDDDGLETAMTLSTDSEEYVDVNGAAEAAALHPLHMVKTLRQHPTAENLSYASKDSPRRPSSSTEVPTTQMPQMNASSRASASLTPEVLSAEESNRGVGGALADASGKALSETSSSSSGTTSSGSSSCSSSTNAVGDTRPKDQNPRAAGVTAQGKQTVDSCSAQQVVSTPQKAVADVSVEPIRPPSLNSRGSPAVKATTESNDKDPATDQIQLPPELGKGLSAETRAAVRAAFVLGFALGCSHGHAVREASSKYVTVPSTGVRLSKLRLENVHMGSSDDEECDAESDETDYCEVDVGASSPVLLPKLKLENITERSSDGVPTYSNHYYSESCQAQYELEHEHEHGHKEPPFHDHDDGEALPSDWREKIAEYWQQSAVRYPELQELAEMAKDEGISEKDTYEAIARGYEKSKLENVAELMGGSAPNSA